MCDCDTLVRYCECEKGDSDVKEHGDPTDTLGGRRATIPLLPKTEELMTLPSNGAGAEESERLNTGRGVELSSNPKDKVGAKKAPLRLVPPALVIGASEALLDGAVKYGPYNWRDESVSLMTYVEAIERHLLAFKDGEDYAEDSGFHHLHHMAACMAIILDAMSIDMCIDDRPPAGAANALLKRMDRSGSSSC